MDRQGLLDELEQLVQTDDLAPLVYQVPLEIAMDLEAVVQLVPLE